MTAQNISTCLKLNLTLPPDRYRLNSLKSASEHSKRGCLELAQGISEMKAPSEEMIF
jgi:hypothetical protein